MDNEPKYISVLGLLGYSLIEYWFGATNKIKANSVWEWVFGKIFALRVKKQNALIVQIESEKVMNTELKAFIKMMIDMGKLGQMVVKDKGLALEEEAPAMALFMSAPSAFSGRTKAFSQLLALDSTGESDLIAFMSSELGIVNSKTAAVMIKGLHFMFAAYQLEQTIVNK